MLKTENLLKNRCRYYSQNERHYERHSPAFSVAERPVCVPYKRKPIRLNRRAAAPAASATVNIQKITKRVFDGRALHGLK